MDKKRITYTLPKKEKEIYLAGQAWGERIGIGVGYTLATGKLYSHFDRFLMFAEELLGRRLYIHEFANKKLWKELRKVYELKNVEPLNNKKDENT